MNSSWFPAADLLKNNNVSFQNKFEQSFGAEKTLEYYFTTDTLTLIKDFNEIGQNKFTTLFTSSIRKYASKDTSNPSDDKDGYSLGATGIYKYTYKDITFNNSIGYVGLFTNGEKYNTHDFSVISNVQKILIKDIKFMAGLSYGRTTYPHYTTDRVDQSLGGSIEFSKKLLPNYGISGKIGLSRTKNISTESDSNFTQDLITFWLSYEAF